MSQDRSKQPDGRLLCLHYLFHRFAQEDITSLRDWLVHETDASLMQLYQLSRASQQIQLFTCVDRQHKAVALITMEPASFTPPKSGHTLAAGTYCLTQLNLQQAQTWSIPDLSEMLSCFMHYLADELPSSGFYWEIHSNDLQFRAGAENAGFKKVPGEERLFVLYIYAG